MARRPDTESDESSQIITETRASSTAHKSKIGNVKRNGGRERVRDGVTQPRHSDFSEGEFQEEEVEGEEDQEEGEEEGSQESAEDVEESSPKGSKRVRLNGNGDGVSAKLSRKRRVESVTSLPPRDADG